MFYDTNNLQSPISTVQQRKNLGQQDQSDLHDPTTARRHYFQRLRELISTDQDYAGAVRHQGRFLYQRQMDAWPHWPVPTILLCSPEETCAAWLGESSQLSNHTGEFR